MSHDLGDLNKLKDTIQDANLNFLVGSGLSQPFLGLLGNIEDLLSELDKRDDIADDKKKIIRTALYRQLFEGVIVKNLDILSGDAAAAGPLENYKAFLRIINSILRNRYSPILNKQVNLFTTNIDVYFEVAFEGLGLECNDGFNGRFAPVFNLSNFRKSTLKRSFHYEKTSEIPVFNLFKLHGSLTWRVVDDSGEKKVKFSPDLGQVKELKDLKFTEVAAATATSTVDSLLTTASPMSITKPIEEFLEEYQKLPIINPTKDKFRLTLLNQNHYELLRIYANELEKENSVLFVMGFSFADEHIREITLRAINSNPTLVVYIFCYGSDSKDRYETYFGLKALKNSNVKIIAPDVKTDGTDEFKFDFATINTKVFAELLRKIEEKPAGA